MAFPANLTNAVDGVTDVVADHLNNLEAKVGIDGSLVTTSLTYLLTNPSSIDPGHKHTINSVSNLAANSLIGNDTGAPATPQALSASQVKNFLALGQADVTGLTTASSPIFAGLTVNGAASLKSAAAQESAPLGAELTDATGWTSTGWTGDYVQRLHAHNGEHHTFKPHHGLCYWRYVELLYHYNG